MVLHMKYIKTRYKPIAWYEIACNASLLFIILNQFILGGSPFIFWICLPVVIGCGFFILRDKFMNIKDKTIIK